MSSITNEKGKKGRGRRVHVEKEAHRARFASAKGIEEAWHDSAEPAQHESTRHAVAVVSQRKRKKRRSES